MSSYDAHSFIEYCGPALHDQSDHQHCPWQVFDRYLDDEERHLLAPIVLGVGIGKRHDQS